MSEASGALEGWDGGGWDRGLDDGGGDAWARFSADADAGLLGAVDPLAAALPAGGVMAPVPEAAPVPERDAIGALPGRAGPKQVPELYVGLEAPKRSRPAPLSQPIAAPGSPPASRVADAGIAGPLRSVFVHARPWETPAAVTAAPSVSSDRAGDAGTMAPAQQAAPATPAAVPLAAVVASPRTAPVAGGAPGRLRGAVTGVRAPVAKEVTPESALPPVAAGRLRGAVTGGTGAMGGRPPGGRPK